MYPDRCEGTPFDRFLVSFIQVGCGRGSRGLLPLTSLCCELEQLLSVSSQLRMNRSPPTNLPRDIMSGTSQSLYLNLPQHPSLSTTPEAYNMILMKWRARWVRPFLKVLWAFQILNGFRMWSRIFVLGGVWYLCRASPIIWNRRAT